MSKCAKISLSYPFLHAPTFLNNGNIPYESFIRMLHIRICTLGLSRHGHPAMCYKANVRAISSFILSLWWHEWESFLTSNKVYVCGHELIRKAEMSQVPRRTREFDPTAWKWAQLCVCKTPKAPSCKSPSIRIYSSTLSAFGGPDPLSWGGHHAKSMFFRPA